MEKFTKDIGEEIISKLKKLNLILEKKLKGYKNGDECPTTSSFKQ